MKKIKIGLAGAGWIGREHGRNIVRHPRAELALVCDSDAEHVAQLRQETGADFRECQTVNELWESDVDAVVIATPNALHAEMCVAAARAGKAIYCEKPMAISLQDCRRVREAVERARVPYLIGYHRRMNPLYQHARGLLDQGALGTPFMVESDYLHHVPGGLDIWSWLGKEQIAGSLFHAGSGHNVDLIRYFCGEIKDVTCMKGIFMPRPQQVETEDTAVALFRFESGAIGKVQFCIGPIAPFQFNFKLYGTHGTVLNNRIWLDTMPHFAEAGHERDGIELPAAWIPDNVQGGVGEPWDKLMDHFVALLADGVACINDVGSAYQTSLACFAAVESARRGTTMAVRDLE
jgi:myo-inositol 2-dehydrogenase/D-chiro-inositol 1-dehydrogenase